MNQQKLSLRATLRIMLFVATGTCLIGNTKASDTPSFIPPIAHAHLLPTQGSNVVGTVVFNKVANGLAVHAHVVNLQPLQQHGFHIHEKGNCKSPDGSSAGGHYNPDGKSHGPSQAEHHAGDLESLRANEWGIADAHLLLTELNFGVGGTKDIAALSLVVHAQPDDYKTQPSGNSGARVACGVIQAPWFLLIDMCRPTTRPSNKNTMAALKYRSATTGNGCPLG